MQTITLNIEDDYIQKFINLLKALPENKVKANYKYIDDLGDTIEVINGKEHIIPSENELKKLKEIDKNGEYTDFDTIE